MPIQKPLLDNREYRVIKLSNNLEVLLISDDKAGKSGAALDVNIGSFYDPVSLPGLAHFLEHLLFMGTEDFPEENEYAQFLSDHAGLANAYTTSEHTNYYFEVGNDYLEGALHRFSRFFVSPLFSESCKDREINAVDSENKKNLQSDVWRLNQIEKTLSNPDHPWHKFSTGNFETLGSKPQSMGIDVRKELMEFHKTYYTASLMKLTLLGKSGLDDLERLAKQYFEDVRDPHPELAIKDTSYAKIPPLMPNQLGKLIKAETVMDVKLLEISFPITDQQPLIKTQPYQYVVHLLGHESKGSLLYYLKSQRLASELASAITHICKGTDYLLVNIELTNLGMENWTEVLNAVFGYIRMLSSVEPQKWIFDEVKTMNNASFLYRQKGKAMQLVSSLAQIMHRPIPRDNLLNFSVPSEFDAAGITDLVNMLNIDNCRVLLAAKNLDGLDSVEPWYGTKYGYFDVPEISTDCFEEFHLPHVNEFIPSNFDLVPEVKDIKKPQPRPRLIINDEYLKLWHKQDDQFNIPKANFNVKLVSNLNGDSVFNLCCADLLVAMVQDLLTDFAYYADLADVLQSVTNLHDGFEIEVQGFSENLHKLLFKVIFNLLNPQFKEERFMIVKEPHERALKNMLYAQPYQMRTANSNFLLLEKSYSIQDRLEAVAKVQFKDMMEFVNKLNSNGFSLECMAVGNITAERAIDLTKQFSKSIPLPQARPKKYSSYLFSSKCFYYNKTLDDDQNVNSLIEVRYQFGDAFDLRMITILAIISQIFKEPVFDQLRTKEQLGYIVISTTHRMRSTMWYKIVVQSEEDSRYLDSRVENFVFNIALPLLENMTNDEYEQNIETVVAHELEKEKNLNEESERYWTSITTGFCDFSKRERIAELAKQIPKEEVLEAFKTYVLSDKRARFALHLRAQKKPQMDLETAMAKAVAQQVMLKNLKIEPAKIQQLMLECRGLKVEEALQLVGSKLQEYMSPEEALKFTQDASAEAMKLVSGETRGGEYIGEYVNSPNEFMVAPSPRPEEDLEAYTVYA